jgi:hypothetical protein
MFVCGSWQHKSPTRACTSAGVITRQGMLLHRRGLVRSQA